MLERLLHVRTGNLALLQPEGDVVPDGHVGIERVGLEDHGDVAVFRLHVVDHVVVNPNLSLVERLQSCDDVEQRGLSASGWSQEHQKLAIADVDLPENLGGHTVSGPKSNSDRKTVNPKP